MADFGPHVSEALPPTAMQQLLTCINQHCYQFVCFVDAGTRQDAVLAVSLAQGAMTSKYLPILCVCLCVTSDAVLSTHALPASYHDKPDQFDVFQPVGLVTQKA